jgi:alanine racemase
MTRHSPPAAHERAWVDVDLAALRRNAEAVRARAGVPLLPMVKADAYGLGVLPTVRALEALDPWGYGVATVAEGRELRDAGVRRRVLVFTPLIGADLDAAHAAGLTPCLGDADAIARWSAIGGGAWHLAIDTGMHRAGAPWSAVAALGALVRAHAPEGAFTHFHSADRTDGSREEQERRFDAALASLPLRPRILHAENSAAVEHHAGSPWSLARPGVFLYGVRCGPGSTLQPEQVAHLRARVVDLRDVPDGEGVSYGATWRARGARRVATLALGYADGYRRLFSNRGRVLLNGREVRVAGVVTMDMTMVDVTGVPCAIGDVATLLGRDGDACLTTNAVADDAGMSPYELLTGLRGRLPRFYAGDPAVGS